MIRRRLIVNVDDAAKVNGKWPLAVAHFPDGWSTAPVSTLPPPGTGMTGFTQANASGLIVGSAYKIIDDTNGTLIPQGSQHIHAVMLVPVEILAPKLDTAGNVTAELTDATHRLKVAQWEHAWETDHTPFGQLVDEFMDKDPDCFYVRVPKIGSGQNAVKVKISTLKPNGDLDASPVEIEMAADPSDPEMLISKSQILVADDPDNAMSGAEDAEELAKRTHKVAIYGKLRAEIEIGSTSSKVEFDVPFGIGKVKSVTVNAVILRDQPGGTPVATESFVWDDLVNKAKLCFAQANVVVLVGSVTIADPPSGVDLSDGMA